MLKITDTLPASLNYGHFKCDSYSAENGSIYCTKNREQQVKNTFSYGWHCYSGSRVNIFINKSTRIIQGVDFIMLPPFAFKKDEKLSFVPQDVHKIPFFDISTSIQNEQNFIIQKDIDYLNISYNSKILHITLAHSIPSRALQLNDNIQVICDEHFHLIGFCIQDEVNIPVLLDKLELS